MNYEQEREEALFNEYCGTNEYQNAYFLSSLEAGPLRDSKIDQAIKAGKFVIVRETEVYCTRTDASIGMATNLVSTHDSREEAKAELNRRMESDPYEDLGIEPRQPAPPLVMVEDPEPMPF